MSRWLFVALVLFSAGPRIFAQAVEQEIAKAEHARVDARRKADSAAHARFVSADYLHVTAGGQLRDRTYAISLPASPKMDVRDLNTQVFGDVAVVTGIQSGTGAGGTVQDARFTHIWQKQKGAWVNVFVQNTPILTAKPPANPAPASTASSPAPTKWPEGKTQDEGDVLKTQRSLNELYARKDAAAYERLTANTFVRINANGTMTARGDFLKAVAGTPELKRVESNNSDFQFRSYGPVAMLTYIDKAMGAPAAGFRMTRVFVKQDGAWKQLVTQFTPLAQP
jgi:hypothetical protein